MNRADLDEFFEGVREASSRAAWSSGVQLARSGALRAEPGEEDEVVLRVALRQGLISHRVILYPADGDWSCDCGGREQPCAHVAAGVIALRRAVESGEDLAASGGGGTIAYRFTRTVEGLALERVVEGAGRTTPLTSTLAALASGRVAGPSFVASAADTEVERALGSRLRGVVPLGVMPGLLAALERCPDIQLDGVPVRASATRLVLEGRVEDEGDGFRVFVEPVPAVTERFRNGVVLCGDTLHATGEPQLRGREREELPRGRHYPADAVAELVSEVLPALRQRMEVEIRTQRLPDARREPPHCVIELKRRGDGLSVLPLIVYGRPATARVDAGRLVHLQGTVPVRDPEAERALARRLRRELELVPGYRAELDAEQAVTFATRARSWDGEFVGDSLDAFRLRPGLVPRLETDELRFEVAFECQDGGFHGRADPHAVLRAWQAGGSLVPLLDGGFAPLPEDWLLEHGQRVADLLAARQGDGGLPPCMLADLARLCAELDQPPPPGFERLRLLIERFDALPAAVLPTDLAATLRGYQRVGVDWLTFLRDAGLGALLADDMGLGKTLQALCAIEGRTLVIAPTSVLHNWAQEIRRFRPGLRCSIYHGTGRSLDPQVDVTLTTYAILRLDAEALCAVSWDCVVLDEAQNIKNPDSLTARSAYRLESRFRIALTGTPVENRLDELWSQLHFLNRGLLGGRSDFEQRYAKPIAAGEARAAEHLRERLRPFVLRRLKRDVAFELPPRTEIVLRCELTPEERAIYDAVRTATREQIVARLSAGADVLAILEALLRLRQASCHCALVPGQQARGSSKIDLLLEELDTVVADGHKALVFSQWTSLLDLVEPHLEAAHVDFTRLDGATRDRAGVVAAFQAEAGPPVMLVSLRAGGTGLNLTAADHVFLLDPWWNPAVEDQAADRAHRIGQDRPVFVYRMIAQDTVEERILTLQDEKRALAEAALGGADQAISLTRDDLLNLLE